MEILIQLLSQLVFGMIESHRTQSEERKKATDFCMSKSRKTWLWGGKENKYNKNTTKTQQAMNGRPREWGGSGDRRERLGIRDFSDPSPQHRSCHGELEKKTTRHTLGHLRLKERTGFPPIFLFCKKPVAPAGWGVGE